MEQQQKLLWTILSVAVLFLVILAACMFIFLPSGNSQAEQAITKAQEPMEWVKADTPQQTESATPAVTEDNIVINTVQPKEIKPIEPNKIVLRSEPETKSQADIVIKETSQKSAVPQQPKQEQPKQQVQTKVQTQTKQTVKQSASSTEYWIQLGAFSTRESADRAVATMKEHNHKASILTGTSNGKTVYRVRTGPYTDKSQADKALGSIKRIKGYDGSYIIK
ncbi:MAG: SPOR domain-containing protein [Spirochaetia bacterium]|nr:SPOR domain-containing protein [Spirochaetia bacterium]